MQRWLVVSVGLVSGCTTPPIARPQPGLLASADAELLQGCYDCLLEARASYRRLAAGADRPQILARVLEADLLIALRERELGLPPSDALADARTVAAELPRVLEAERYIALVDAIPAAELGVPRGEQRAFLSAHSAAAPPDEHRAWLATGRLREPVRRYLQLALDCAYPVSSDHAPPPDPDHAPPPDPDVPTSAVLDPPLLAYRTEACGLGRKAVLAAVRAREPRFVETSFFIANVEIALVAQEGPAQAKAHLAEVLARFPASPAIIYLTAALDLLIGDCAEALQFYDRTLVLQPAHDDAMLGRAICLTTLGRPREAIDAATRLIDLSPDNRAQAYYWRARNHRALAGLGDARSDISAAKDLIGSAEVLSLAGIIEYEQGDLDPARTDLTDAIAAYGSDCTARWYLALVDRQRKRWLVAGTAFEDAMGCYRDRARATTEKLRALEARTNVDPAHRARTAASLKTSVEDDTRQQHLAALTGASCAAAGGDIPSARTLAGLAAEDPALADRVTKLRDWLDKPRPSH